MPLEAKICGLKKKEDIILSINLGASYCGFIVNFPRSHRNIKSKSSLAKLNNISDEGVEIESEGAIIQGIFGIGGEKSGKLFILADRSSTIVVTEQLNDKHKDLILTIGMTMNLPFSLQNFHQSI